MLRRVLLTVAICLGVTAAGSVAARAVEIDPDLRARFAAKAADETVPVLMIFDQPDRDVSGVREKSSSLTPVARRKAVLQALRQQARQNHADAAALLASPRWQSEVHHVRDLYLANAMAFDATWAVVSALADLPDQAVLVHDRSYRMTSATRRGVNRAPASASAVAADTVWSVKYIHADRVWRDLGLDGSGVIVGHIDTGVWLAHPDLAGRLWRNPGEIPDNGIDDDHNGFIDDINGWDFGEDDNNPDDDAPGAGHGTHTAGTVVGDGSGGTLTGVAPGAQLMALKVWQDNGTGAGLSTLWAAEQYAVENGARIITMSLSFSGPIPAVFMRAERYNDDNIRDAGVVFFNAAGNDHLTQAPPVEVSMISRVPAPWNALPVPRSSTGGVISVGGTGYVSDSVYLNSSRGPVTWGDIEPWRDWPLDPEPGLIKPDLGAPGEWVNSTVIGGGYSGNTWSGTSMACPHAAGVAALMLQKNPSLSPAGVDSLLELNAIDLGAPGKDNDYGSGRLDAWAAVNAVPATLNPDLVWTAVLPDPAGDGIIDPGQVNEIAVALRNSSPVTGGEDVTGALAIVPNPWVSVADSVGSYGAIAIGDTVSNTAAPFTLRVSADAPHGFEFTMLLTVSANGTYQQTFDIPWYVGLPDWRTLDRGGVFLSVTDQGSIGYMSQDQVEGHGMGYRDSGSELFVGSFWAGTDTTYVCSRDYGGLDTENAEWIVSDTAPNGRVRDLSTGGMDQIFGSVFTDGGHARPKPLQVAQTATTYGTPENDQFVILEYTLTNQGPHDLPELFTGVFCDFDVADSGANLGGSDTRRNLVYINADDGNYVGIALLADEAARNLTLINNPLYVYPTSTITDADKISLLRGDISEPVADTPDDWSALVSSVVSLPADGGQAVVAYALVIGGSLTELEAAFDAASEAYGSGGPTDPDLPPAVTLAQNVPNPFNPGTEISFTVAEKGPVDLAVYDLRGRRLRTLVSESRPVGKQTVTWDGRDDDGQRVPSGIYIYKYAAGGRVIARKMTLLK